MDEEIPMYRTVINHPILSCQAVLFFAEAAEPSTSEAISSRGGSWEMIDESELAREMSVSFPGNGISDIPLPDLDPDDFERLYQWFLS
jgi:hypothetical protein